MYRKMKGIIIKYKVVRKHFKISLIKINTFFNFCILSVFKFFLIVLRPCDGGELAYFHSGYLLLLLLVQHFNIVKIVCCLFFFILLLLCFKIIATLKSDFIYYYYLKNYISFSTVFSFGVQ